MSSAWQAGTREATHSKPEKTYRRRSTADGLSSSCARGKGLAHGIVLLATVDRLRFGLAGVWGDGSIERRGSVVIGQDCQVTALLKAHGERLYRLLVRLTLREDVAEDLLQDLAVKLSQAGGFAGAENAYAYARKAAVNLAFSWIRSRRRKREQPVENLDRPGDDPPAWSRLVRVEEIRRMLAHMEELNDRDRLILAMRYFDEAGFEEIAGVIGGNSHQARAFCHKAIRQLRAAMMRAQRPAFDARREVTP